MENDSLTQSTLTIAERLFIDVNADERGFLAILVGLIFLGVIGAINLYNPRGVKAWFNRK